MTLGLALAVTVPSQPMRDHTTRARTMATSSTNKLTKHALRSTLSGKDADAGWSFRTFIKAAEAAFRLVKPSTLKGITASAALVAEPLHLRHRPVGWYRQGQKHTDATTGGTQTHRPRVRTVCANDAKMSSAGNAQTPLVSYGKANRRV